MRNLRRKIIVAVSGGVAALMLFVSQNVAANQGEELQTSSLPRTHAVLAAQLDTPAKRLGATAPGLAVPQLVTALAAALFVAPLAVSTLRVIRPRSRKTL
jgi:hypothetical protein